jgi:thermitase
MSLGGSYASYFAIDMVNYGLEENVVVIASMGNDGQEIMKYPAGYSGVIAVGATNGRDELVLFSSTGYHNSVCAPGFDIISAGSLGGGVTASHYQWMSGTSMSAPFVTGLVTYMLTFNPYLTPGQIKTVIEQSAYDLGDPGYDPRFGYGRVDVLSTIGAVQSGGTPTSAYSDKLISVQLTNSAPTYDNGISGYEDAIPNETVYLFDARERFIRLTKTNDYGFATFPMLPPGTYYVRSAYQGLQRELKVINFGSADVINDTTFAHNVSVYNIQTLYNDGGDTDQDSVIDVYTSAGTLVTSYDVGYLDSTSVAMLPGQTYYIRISMYSGSDPGHYSLWVSTTSRANGTGQDDLTSGGDDAYEQNDSMNSAKTIYLDTEYDLYLADDDWFKIQIPN